MSLGRDGIIKNISTKAFLSQQQSKLFFESFLDILKNTKQFEKINISKFGSFFIHSSVERIGRNPKTKDSYIIPVQKKLSFQASKKVKNIIN